MPKYDPDILNRTAHAREEDPAALRERLTEVLDGINRYASGATSEDVAA